jgi:hypothetical protein
VTLRFNIVYTRDAVAHLRPFLASLLERTDFEFRLVANACTRREEAILKDLCATRDRLEFYRFRTRAFSRKLMASHGVVLDRLQQMESSDHFCFMDSDIFAVGDLTSDEILRDLDGHAALFSGAPVWSTPEDQSAPPEPERFYGPQSRTAAGVCLGLSYFAVYDNRVLGDLRRSTGVTFRKLKRKNPLLGPNLDALERMGAVVDTYDTAKFLNLLLQIRGHALRVKDLPALEHLGGMSLLARRHLRSQPVPVSGSEAAEFEDDLRTWRSRKLVTCQHFGQLIRALTEREPFDDRLELDDPAVLASVRRTSDHLVELYRRYGKDLD